MLAKGGRVLRGCGLLVRLGQCTPQLPPVRVPPTLLPPVAHLHYGLSSNCMEANLTYEWAQPLLQDNGNIFLQHSVNAYIKT